MGGVSRSYAFSDATCQTPIALLPETVPPDRIATTIVGLCSNNFEIHERGPLFSGPVYQRSTDGCIPLPVPAGELAYELGADVTAEYEPATPVIGDGTTRIRTLAYRTASGIETTNESYLWDTQTGSKCVPRTESTNGSSICAPIWSPQPASLYSDTACTVGLSSMTSDCRERGGSIHFPDLSSTYQCSTGTSADIRAYSRDPGLTNVYELGPGNSCTLIDQAAHPLRALEMVSIDPSQYAPIEQRR
jgi:hypothetical protein